MFVEFLCLCCFGQFRSSQCGCLESLSNLKYLRERPGWCQKRSQMSLEPKGHYLGSGFGGELYTVHDVYHSPCVHFLFLPLAHTVFLLSTICFNSPRPRFPSFPYLVFNCKLDCNILIHSWKHSTDSIIIMSHHLSLRNTKIIFCAPNIIHIKDYLQITPKLFFSQFI